MRGGAVRVPGVCKTFAAKGGNVCKTFAATRKRRRLSGGVEGAGRGMLGRRSGWLRGICLVANRPASRLQDAMSSSSGTERRKSPYGMASAQAAYRRRSTRAAGLKAPRTASTSRDRWAWTYTIGTGGARVSSSALRTPPSGVERQPKAPMAAAPGASVPERWVTKRELAAHLHVALRWIESQHHHGLPHARRGGVVRYRISEVERWLCGEHLKGRA